MHVHDLVASHLLERCRPMQKGAAAEERYYRQHAGLSLPTGRQANALLATLLRCPQAFARRTPAWPR
jgi:hypothetical protein